MFEKLKLWGVILLLTIVIILLIKKQIISKRAMAATTAVGGGAVGSYALYSAMGKILLPAILLILVLVAVVVVMAKTGKGSGAGSGGGILGGLFGGGTNRKQRKQRHNRKVFDKIYSTFEDLGYKMNRWGNSFRAKKDDQATLFHVTDDGTVYSWEAIPGTDYDQFEKVETEDTVTFINPYGEDFTYKKDDSHISIPDETDPTGKIIFV